MLARSVAPEELREAAETRGMSTMYAHAAALVRSGITSPAEVRRVLGETIQ
jgi:type II secretory ATPase GspE/PulE/Tfp pilus assembly ATPase PilB-like protein